MGHESEFSSKHPPLARKSQIAALHFGQADVLALFDLTDVFTESTAQRSLALGRALRRFANVNQLAL